MKVHSQKKWEVRWKKEKEKAVLVGEKEPSELKKNAESGRGE